MKLYGYIFDLAENISSVSDGPVGVSSLFMKSRFFSCRRTVGSTLLKNSSARVRSEKKTQPKQQQQQRCRRELESPILIGAKKMTARLFPSTFYNVQLFDVMI